MGVRCSLFGCNYGDSEIEREREERGSEVVMTVREFETCDRCGNTRIISENTGVTSLETGSTTDGSDAVADPGDGTDTPAGADPDVTPEERPDAADGDDRESAAVLDDDGTTATHGEDRTAPDPGDDEAPAPAEPTAAADDLNAVDPDESAQILGEDDGQPPAASGGDDPAGAADGTPDPSDVIEEAEPDGDERGRITGTGDWPDHDGGRTAGERAATGAEAGPAESDGDADADDGADTDDDAVILDETAGETIDPHAGADPVEAVDHDPWPDAAGEPTTTETRAQRAARADATDPDEPEDDAVIMGEDAAGGTDWPDHGAASTGAGESGTRADAGDAGGVEFDHDPWPEQSGADRGWDATTDDVEATVGVSGLTPDAGGDVDGDSPTVAPSGRPGADATGGDPARESTGGPAGGSAPSRREASGAARAERGSGDALSCSTCDHAVPVGGSPHAPGDICPDCARGYLEE